MQKVFSYKLKVCGLAMLFFHFVGLLSLFSQQLIRGVVKDKYTNQNLEGVAIAYKDGAGVFTNREGRFEIPMDNSGKDLYANYLGYKTISISWSNQIIQDLVIYLEEESLTLQTSVITGSKFEKPLAESTVSIDVLKPRQRDQLNANTVRDMIERVPGVQIIDGQPVIRGGAGYSYGAGSRVQLLMDDLPILQPDAALPHWDDLPVELIGQVEILKGASSALYGSSAMNGIIHFRSQVPLSNPVTSLQTNVRVYHSPRGSNQWWNNKSIPFEQQHQITHLQKYGDIDVSAALSWTDKNSFLESVSSENARAYLSLKKRWNDRFTSSLGLNANRGESTSYFYWDGEGSFVGEVGSYSTSKKLRFSVDPGISYFTRTGFRHRILSRWYSITNQNDNDQSNKSQNVYGEYQCSKTMDSIGLQMVGGIFAAGSFVDAPLYGDTIFKTSNLAMFLQAEKRMFKDILISAGLRWERFGIQGPSSIAGKNIDAHSSESKPVFRFGINAKLNKAGYLRASWGQAYRFPSLAEKFISTSAGGLKIKANPELASETGQTAEAGFKQGFVIGAWKAVADASIFWQEYRDMMEFNLVFEEFQLSFQSQNVGDTRITGQELSFQTQGPLGPLTCTILGGMTWINPKFLEWDTTGRQLPINEWSTATRGQLNVIGSSASYNILKYRAKQTARGDITLTYNSWSLGMDLLYSADVPAVDYLFETGAIIQGVKEFHEKHDKGYIILGARCSKVFKKWEIQLNVHNLTNQTYSVRPGLREAPISTSLRIQYRIQGRINS